MAENEKDLPVQPEDKGQEKKAWQQTKENWYDKIPLTLKQLDWIVGICLTLLGLCFLLIILDATVIYKVFG